MAQCMNPSSFLKFYRSIVDLQCCNNSAVNKVIQLYIYIYIYIYIYTFFFAYKHPNFPEYREHCKNCFSSLSCLAPLLKII